MTQVSTLSRDEQMLAEIAERDFALACRIHDEVMVAERAEVPEMARAYQRATRSLRQTLALKARLPMDQDDRRHKAEARAESEKAARIHKKKAQVSTPLERAIWDEHEDDDSTEQAIRRLDELLNEAALLDGFLDEPVEQIIRRLAEKLGYHADHPRRRRSDHSSAAPRPRRHQLTPPSPPF
jgi:hypothetical protein